jgi:hypothetical protein
MAMASDYQPTGTELKGDSLQGMMEGYVTVYKYWLRGRPLTRILTKLLIAPDREEAPRLIKQLTSTEGFIEEAQYTIDILCHTCGIIELTDEAWDRKQALHEAEQEAAKRSLYLSGRQCYNDSLPDHLPSCEQANRWDDLSLEEQKNYFNLNRLIALGAELARRLQEGREQIPCC